MLTSAPACRASMNSFVPDLAIVPRLLTRSVQPQRKQRNKANEKFRLSIELALIRQALEPDLIQCIRRIANEFTKENLLVTVECIDDQTQQLVNLSLKSKCLCLSHLHIRH
ncbi:hypothetical protein H5410_032062 [Solanum commersonii]|uniref:Uncharacterized protein n=1 Tax=Solanum commersonii TaxID=4109 RepID=A0A9J5YNJ6_SOLCO|nr:hypothetical protein H5410_032062 [Solanum commersonii]